MKLKSDLTINGKAFRKGESAPMLFIYPFFLVHMGMFGLSGFLMAYAGSGTPLLFLYLHGGIAIFVYLVFYLAIFGRDEVKWMLINAGLGLMGIWLEIETILGWFGKQLSDFSPWVHVTPFLYYILYTFLLRQMLLDLAGARERPGRKRLVETLYVLGSLLVYGALWLAK
ncbi:MAG TPA: hypothetical protein VFQ84_02560 [Arenimonas sp.]|uniref:hypothetical protein n=1 Tax=Arenimonas sp. TaxID=1872635 RepID=UPI002D803BC0|nr:hypothetical protein [Arenimonas sp.]HEU0152209.1 hypothetical protein [Arenimonas sp.]